LGLVTELLVLAHGGMALGCTWLGETFYEHRYACCCYGSDSSGWPATHGNKGSGGLAAVMKVKKVVGFLSTRFSCASFLAFFRHQVVFLKQAFNIHTCILIQH
jgi:hypothetical protein